MSTRTEDLAASASSLLRDLTAAFEETLAAVLPEPPVDAPGGEDRITEAMRYSLCLPGKRLRPLFALATAAAVGADPLPLRRFAVG